MQSCTANNLGSKRPSTRCWGFLAFPICSRFCFFHFLFFQYKTGLVAPAEVVPGKPWLRLSPCSVLPFLRWSPGSRHCPSPSPLLMGLWTPAPPLHMLGCPWPQNAAQLPVGSLNHAAAPEADSSTTAPPASFAFTSLVSKVGRLDFQA